MTPVEATKTVSRGPRVWPLGIKAYHALGEMETGREMFVDGTPASGSFAPFISQVG